MPLNFFWLSKKLTCRQTWARFCLSLIYGSLGNSIGPIFALFSVKRSVIQLTGWLLKNLTNLFQASFDFIKRTSWKRHTCVNNYVLEHKNSWKRDDIERKFVRRWTQCTTIIGAKQHKAAVAAMWLWKRLFSTNISTQRQPDY